MIKLKNKKMWKIAAEGVHNAVVVDVVGDNDAQKGCDSIRLVWEVEATLDNGRRFTVTKFYRSHDELVRDFESVLGSQHPIITGDEEDLEKLIGVSCRVDVVHNRKKDGEMFPHVDGILSPARNQLMPSAEYVRLKDRRKAREADETTKPTVIAPQFKDASAGGREAA